MPTAREFWIAGAGHAAAAEALTQTEAGATFHSALTASIYLLIGNALELTLKAALLHHGGSAHMAKRIGHNLNDLLAAAEAQGFTQSTANLPELVALMHASHLGHYWRYMEARSQTVPDMIQAVRILRQHVVEVGKLIGANAPTA